MESLALAVNIAMDEELAALFLETLGQAVGEAVEIVLFLGKLEILGAEALAVLVLLVEHEGSTLEVLAVTRGHVGFVGGIGLLPVLGVLVGLAFALVAPLAVEVVVEHDAEMLEAALGVDCVNVAVDWGGRDEGSSGQDEGSGELHGCGWWRSLGSGSVSMLC